MEPLRVSPRNDGHALPNVPRANSISDPRRGSLRRPQLELPQLETLAEAERKRGSRHRSMSFTQQQTRKEMQPPAGGRDRRRDSKSGVEEDVDACVRSLRKQWRALNKQAELYPRSTTKKEQPHPKQRLLSRAHTPPALQRKDRAESVPTALNDHHHPGTDGNDDDKGEPPGTFQRTMTMPAGDLGKIMDNTQGVNNHLFWRGGSLEIIRRQHEAVEEEEPTDGCCGTRLCNSTMRTRVKSAVFGVHDPRGTFRRTWDVFFVAFLVYNIIEIPFRVSFEIAAPTLSAIWTLNILVDCYFLSDVVINFRTGYYVDGILVTDGRKIARRYFFGWFWLDFLTSLPYDVILSLWIDTGDDEQSTSLLRVPRAVRLFRYMRVFKLMRIAKMFNVMSRWDDEETTIAVIMRFLKLVIVIFFVTHLSACLLMLAANVDKDVDAGAFEYGPNSWVERTTIFEVMPITTSNLYLVCFYWAISTVATVGFGDVTVATKTEIICMIFVMIAGGLVFSYIIANISSLVSSGDAHREAVRQKMKGIRAYMSRRRLPKELKESIRAHFEYTWQISSIYDEQSFLEDLPSHIRMPVILHLYRGLINKVPFLSQMGSESVSMMCMMLKPLHVTAGDFIFKQNQHGNEMYLIDEGQIEIIIRETRERRYRKIVRCVLEKGSYFGEYALLSAHAHARREASSRAVTNANLLSLTRDDWIRLLELFPRVRNKMLRRARKQWHELANRLDDSPRSELRSVRRDVQKIVDIYKEAGGADDDDNDSDVDASVLAVSSSSTPLTDDSPPTNLDDDEGDTADGGGSRRRNGGRAFTPPPRLSPPPNQRLVVTRPRPHPVKPPAAVHGIEMAVSSEQPKEEEEVKALIEGDDEQEQAGQHEESQAIKGAAKSSSMASLGDVMVGSQSNVSLSSLNTSEEGGPGPPSPWVNALRSSVEAAKGDGRGVMSPSNDSGPVVLSEQEYQMLQQTLQMLQLKTLASPHHDDAGKRPVNTENEKQ